MQDLARWADGTYHVSGEALPDPDGPNNSESETDN